MITTMKTNLIENFITAAALDGKLASVLIEIVKVLRADANGLEKLVAHEMADDNTVSGSSYINDFALIERLREAASLISIGADIIAGLDSPQH